MEDVAQIESANIKANFSQWEDESSCLAPLTLQERESIIELNLSTSWKQIGLTTSKRSLKHLEEESTKGFSLESVIGPNVDEVTFHSASEFINKAEKLNLFDIKIESSQEFLNWYSTLEEKIEREQDICYRDYVTQLQNHQCECQILLQQLNEALTNLQNLSDQYTSVSLKTSALHTDCEHLLAEQTRLSNEADTTENKIKYFTEVNNISKKLNSPAFHVTSESFIPLLAKIDEGIRYMNNNPTFLESSLYLAKYKQCLNRALTMIKFYAFKTLENSRSQVSPAPGSTKPTTDNALILFYSKFRIYAPRINVLMTEIEDRGQNSIEYNDLLSDCHSCYFTQRKALLEPCVIDAVRQLTQQYSKDCCSLIRSSCAFLVHVCEDEYNLYDQFFSSHSPELNKFLQGLCSILYDALRPLIIHIDHLETLSGLCNILRRGMIDEHIKSNPGQLAPLSYIVIQLLEDCQERLVYRAHIYMQSDIANFKPSPGDLAYPSKLEMMENIAETLTSQEKHFFRNDSVSSLTSIRSSTSEEVATINAGNDERLSRVGSSPADIHGMWYPTVRRTLMCLSKVYRCVDRSIFQGLSLEALSACMQSLSDASLSISKSSSVLDAHLFEIKHLLILREQLAPFQVDANLREMSLDWSKLKEAAMVLVQKRGKLFSLTSNNSLLEFIVEGTPQVKENILEPKRNVDKHLKRICEQFITASTEVLVGPISAFLAKVEVMHQMSKEKGGTEIHLKNQPFAVPEKVGEVVTAAQKNIRKNIPLIRRALELYLSNKETESILFKPIRNNVISEFSNLLHLLNDHYSEEDELIIACPSQEEIAVFLSSLVQ